MFITVVTDLGGQYKPQFYYNTVSIRIFLLDYLDEQIN